MSFPDFLDNNYTTDNNNNNQNIILDSFQQSSSSLVPPIEPHENQFDFISSNAQQDNKPSPLEQIPLDNEEQQRIEQRQIEEAERKKERRKVIAAKMELVLKLKNENREKARAYMREFE